MSVHQNAQPVLQGLDFATFVGLRRRAALIGAGTVVIGVLPPTAARAEQISVTHWGALMYGAPYAVGMAKGFFRDAGVDIDGILTSHGGGTTVRNVLAGGLPYGEVALSAAVAARKQGLDIRIVNGGVATVADILWVVKPDSPVHSIQQLADRKVAYTGPKSVTDMLLVMALESAGVAPQRVTRVATGGIGPGLVALDQDGVAAAPIMDPIWSREQDRYRPLFFVKDVLPPMMQTVGITTPAFSRSSPDKLRSIIAARARAVDYIYAHPEDAGAIFARAYALAEPLGTAAVRNMAALHYWSDGRLNLKAMDEMVRGLRIMGEADGPVDWSSLVDDQFLAPAQKAPPS
jgi:NitT/TauT family transport system substrate-binding protein